MRPLAVLSFFLFIAGCQSNQSQPSSQVEVLGEALASHDAVGGAAPVDPANLLKGKVLEKIDAARYSYLRLATENGEIWAAVFQTDIDVGEEVTVVGPMPMDGFKSETLNRTFDHIVFGTLQGTGGRMPDKC